MEVKEIIYKMNLSNLREKEKFFNFSCPFCKEGKSPWKRRAYLLSKDDSYVFYCHNCGLSISFCNFLKEFDAIYNTNFYNSFRKKLKDINIVFRKDKKKGIKNYKEVSEFKKLIKYRFKDFNKNYFNEVIYSRKAIEYLKSRKLPIEKIKKFYIGKDIENFKYRNMIIIPFFDDDNYIYGFQGRTFEGRKKYDTFSKNDIKVYNIFNIDFSDDVYIFEGIFDSLFIENSIAVLGVNNNIDFLKKIIKKRVIVFDNDLPGLEKAYEEAKKGEVVFIYPDNFKFKDINDYVINTNDTNIKKLIRNNIYDGTKALTKIAFKIKKMKGV